MAINTLLDISDGGFLDTEQAVAYTRTSPSTLYRARKAKRLRSYPRPNGEHRYTRPDLDEWAISGFLTS